MNRLFILNELPEPLTEKETKELFIKLRDGEDDAKDVLVLHNVKLVVSRVMKKFNLSYDREELIAIGNVGLMKAINNFDVSKNIMFSTYAVRCIDNEILMFLRKKDNNLDSISLEENITNTDDLKLKDLLSDNKNIHEEFMDSVIYECIRKLVDELPVDQKEIVKLAYGFDGDSYFQSEIAEKFGMSQVSVSRRITKALKSIEEGLVLDGIIDKPRQKCKLKKM